MDSVNICNFSGLWNHFEQKRKKHLYQFEKKNIKKDIGKDFSHADTNGNMFYNKISCFKINTIERLSGMKCSSVRHAGRPCRLFLLLRICHQSVWNGHDTFLADLWISLAGFYSSHCLCHVQDIKNSFGDSLRCFATRTPVMSTNRDIQPSHQSTLADLMSIKRRECQSVSSAVWSRRTMPSVKQVKPPQTREMLMLRRMLTKSECKPPPHKKLQLLKTRVNVVWHLFPVMDPHTTHLKNYM